MKVHISFAGALLLLSLYFMPLLILDYAIFQSSFLTKRVDLLESLSLSFGRTGLAFADILRLLTGVVTGGLVAYFARRPNDAISKIYGWILTGVVGLALILLFGTYHAIELNRANLEEGYMYYQWIRYLRAGSGIAREAGHVV